MVILLFLSLFFILNGLELDIKAMNQRFIESRELMLNRLDYGTSAAFLPMNLAMSLAAMVDYPEEYETFDWDDGFDDWILGYNYYFTYTDGYLTQYIIHINMPGAIYYMTIDLTWEGGFLTGSTSTTIYNGMLIVASGEHYYYTDDGLFESYLLQDWDMANEVWIDAEQWTSTIEDGRITVMNIEEYDEDLMNWRPDERLTYTWDGELITSQLVEYYADEVWTNSDLHYMYYLDNELMDYILSQVWDGGWVDDHKVTYSYEEDLQTYNLTLEWIDGAWVNAEQEFITYDDLDRQIFSHKDEFFEGDWLNDSETYLYYTVENNPDVIAHSSIELSAYPNPFNPSTTLSWQTDGSFLPQTVKIYDLRGKKVNELAVITGNNGTGAITWNGCDQNGFSLPSGIYFFRLEGVQKTAKMLLLK